MSSTIFIIILLTYGFYILKDILSIKAKFCLHFLIVGFYYLKILSLFLLYINLILSLFPFLDLIHMQTRQIRYFLALIVSPARAFCPLIFQYINLTQCKFKRRSVEFIIILWLFLYIIVFFYYRIFLFEYF